jgi:acetyl-CoA synthetase
VVDDLVRNRADDGAPDIIELATGKIDADEIERVLESHDSVAEAACVGAAHGVHAFVVVSPDARASDVLEADLKGLVRRDVGPAAVPQSVRFLSALPRSKSGTVARRILRKVAAGDLTNLGDPAQLADPGALDELLKRPATA